MSRRIQSAILMFAMGALVACEETAEPRVPTTLRLTPETQLMLEATSKRFTATVLDANGQPIEGSTVSWHSDHPEWVTVDSLGLASAITIPRYPTVGTIPPIVITATSGALTASATITLSPDGTFEAWPDTNGLYIGMTRGLATWLLKGFSGYPSVPIYPVPGTVIWKSENPAIVQVSEAGVITAVGAGHARVVASFDTRTANVEVYVSAPPAIPLRFIAVASGATFIADDRPYAVVHAARACGLTADGAMYCWGTFTDPAQPADRCGTTSGGTGRYTLFRYRCTEIPQRVETNLSFTGLVVGGSFTCGLAKRVYCWGENSGGELGIGVADQTTHGINPIAGTDEFTELRGSVSPCAIRTDRALLCWGRGIGAVPTMIGTGMTWRTIADAGSCGLRSDSTAYCWGSTSSPLSVGGSTRWKSIGSGGPNGQGSLCAIAVDDSVFCGSKLEARQTVPESIIGLVGYAQSFYTGFGVDVCGLTAGGDLLCPGRWTAENLSMKLNKVYGYCAIAVDQKVYCRRSPYGPLLLVPGQ